MLQWFLISGRINICIHKDSIEASEGTNGDDFTIKRTHNYEQFGEDNIQKV